MFATSSSSPLTFQRENPHKHSVSVKFCMTDYKSGPITAYQMAERRTCLGKINREQKRPYTLKLKYVHVMHACIAMVIVDFFLSQGILLAVINGRG